METDESRDERMSCILVPEGDPNLAKNSSLSQTLTPVYQRTQSLQQATQHEYRDQLRYDTICEPTQRQKCTRTFSFIRTVTPAQY